jgi:membrane-bound lytic murein transglycosylase B
MRYGYKLILVLGILGLVHMAHADEALLKKQEAQAFIQEMVDKHHFKRDEVETALKEAEFKSRIIDLMTRPFEKKNWDTYRSVFLTSERLDDGIKFWQANAATLAQAEKQFGVPASVIVAILGVETKYGKTQGTHRVLDALSTLAFYYPKRGAYFARELREYFLLCREQGVPVTEYVGSYAGAMGQPQFMPSNYRVYAVGFGEGKYPDLIHENKDVIASVANYFKRHGWRTGGEVVESARIQGNQYQSLEKNSRHANYAYQHLIKSGVHPVTPLKNPPEKAGVIEVDTAGDGQAYWVAYPNFYVITRYNTSPQYALVVHLLSKQLQQGFDAAHQEKSKA